MSGWFWRADSARDTLDPSLRKILDDEARDRRQPSPPTTPSPPTLPAQTRTPPRTETQTQTPPSDTSHADAAPPESLFPDGRYAHLWKTYKPLAEQEFSHRSDSDRLNDIVEAYNERKALIGRAALENCVMEQIAERDCFSAGGLHAKMTMCRDESRAFNRCYQMQARFLKALGYKGVEGRSEDDEEKVQMHADRLFHEMLRRERVAEEAKSAGLAEPSFKPLIQGNEHRGLEIYSADKRRDIEKKLAGMTPAEREMEISLLVAESRASVQYAEKIENVFEEEKLSRADRRQRGKETLGDTIKRMWGWDK